MPSSLFINILLLIVSAAGVWFSASKLTFYLDAITERTGLGRAFAGALILGGATSLPEIVTTITATTAGAAQLAGSNLIGGIAMQIAVLAVIDLVALRGRALASVASKPELLMQGVVLVTMLALVIVAISMSEIVSFFNVGTWPFIFALVYVSTLYLSYHYEGHPKWKTVHPLPKKAQLSKTNKTSPFKELSNFNIYLRMSIAILGVLFSGVIVAFSAEAFVEQTGTSGELIGATILALATSLPEVTTTWSAVSIGAYGMAIANILGTNSIEVALLLPADIFYREGLIINELKDSAVFLCGIGILMTCTYLWGLLERNDKTIFGMGVESAAAIVIYIVGMVIYSGM